MRVSYSRGYYAPIPDEHIFPMYKFSGLHRHLIDTNLINPSDVITPSMVDMVHLLTVHTTRYSNCIINGDLNSKELRRSGLPGSMELAKRSRLAVQGTLNAALMALQDGIAGNLAGGTHHAMQDHGEGFCVFNDAAVAIKVLQQSMWAKKILVIDCDVHQGNGTAEIFKDDPDVYTFSLHGEKNYPFNKPPSTLDVGLPDQTGDTSYLQAPGTHWMSSLINLRLIWFFIWGGIDPLDTDYFGRLSLTLNGLEQRDRLVIQTVLQNDAPLVLLLSGGYAPSLKETVLAHTLMYQAALELTY